MAVSPPELASSVLHIAMSLRAALSTRRLATCALSRSMATAAPANRQKLKVGLIPGDGIGHEVIPAGRAVLEALGSDIPKPEFVDLEAGFELFATAGEALPEETVEYVSQR